MWSTEALVMNMNEPVKPGIYRHFKGNLYFVLGLAFSADDLTNFHIAEVIYHPLYQCENIGWRKRLYSEFFENVNKPEFSYSGPRFAIVMEWNMPTILPGKSFIGAGGGIRYKINRAFLNDEGKILIDCSRTHVVMHWVLRDPIPLEYEMLHDLRHLVF